MSIEIPDEYEIESKPKNITYVMPDNLGKYKFICKQAGNKIQIISEVRFKNANIPVSYYKNIKEFYKLIIDKQLEKVVLSKI